ncbi:hypothetical protein BDV95DRAFT_600325 [Massariosphaeria phaeospora]|uniref:Uncharacterized protein n=1 Tax=Massariosphaeria phaeospora TaxID=100035 RepID=A0A7C8I246_9PLEO|nr:hypothetical protein BDV95DRAFT_600325 [Massariosphaeria phaeospora]
MLTASGENYSLNNTVDMESIGSTTTTVCMAAIIGLVVIFHIDDIGHLVISMLDGFIDYLEFAVTFLGIFLPHPRAQFLAFLFYHAITWIIFTVLRYATSALLRCMYNVLRGILAGAVDLAQADFAAWTLAYNNWAEDRIHRKVAQRVAEEAEVRKINHWVNVRVWVE